MGLHTGKPQLATEDYIRLDVHHTANIEAGKSLSWPSEAMANA